MSVLSILIALFAVFDIAVLISSGDVFFVLSAIGLEAFILWAFKIIGVFEADWLWRNGK